VSEEISMMLDHTPIPIGRRNHCQDETLRVNCSVDLRDSLEKT
jgi:hypothetical protein